MWGEYGGLGWDGGRGWGEYGGGWDGGRGWGEYGGLGWDGGWVSKEA